MINIYIIFLLFYMSDEDQLTLKDLEIGINVMWITLSTYLVFLM